jgi:hypothetical protein
MPLSNDEDFEPVGLGRENGMWSVIPARRMQQSTRTNNKEQPTFLWKVLKIVKSTHMKYEYSSVILVQDTSAVETYAILH